jgi:hypothetical protein
VPTLTIFHEVDDVDHWLASPKRKEIMGPLGMTARTFRDPGGSNRVGLIVETPSVEAWQEILQSDVAAEAMKYDGVRPETMISLEEGQYDRITGSEASEAPRCSRDDARAGVGERSRQGAPTNP